MVILFTRSLFVRTYINYSLNNPNQDWQKIFFSLQAPEMAQALLDHWFLQVGPEKWKWNHNSDDWFNISGPHKTMKGNRKESVNQSKRTADH